MSDLIANRYRTLEELGQGAMGVVWLVEDTSTGQRVALKRVTGDVGEQAVLRFKQEFRLMTQLRHPNCCAVHDFGVLEDGVPYFTMEVVPGKGLDEMLPLPAAEIMKVLPQLLEALGHVHALGLVHRDLKSANVRVRPDGVVKLMDFGLMEYAGASDLPISGTLGYLAPEVIKRGPVDQRADLYAVGALVHELMWSKLPFERDSRVEILRAHVSEPPPPLGGDDPRLAEVVKKLLAKEPIDRYQTAGEVLEALGFDGGAVARTLLAPPLIGRDYETMQLFDALGNLVCGEPGTTFVIQGGPGIGKSRLLKDFRSAVQLEGTLPFVTGVGRGEASTPYAPFREILSGLIPTFREQVPALLNAQAPVLASLVPELGGAAAAELDDPAKEKVRLQGAVTTLFAALAVKQPFLILLEDWHAADPLSVELLDYLQRNLQGLPIMRLVATRQIPAADWAASATKLVLPKLGEAAIARLVGTVLGTDEVAAPFLETVTKLSEGNPFHVERLLEHLVAAGVLVPRRGGWATDVALDQNVLPRDLQGLLMRKLAALPEDAISVARVAAVFGRAFDLPLLKELTGFGDERLFDALGALLRQQILVQDDETKTYGWAQDLFKDVVYESFTPEHRTAMHARVAQALERRIGRVNVREAPFDLVKAVADHNVLGCRPDKIVTFALEAGRRSAALFATREAEHYLGTALTLLKSDDSPRWQKPRLLALRLLGDSRRLSGQVQGAKEMYLEAIPLAQHVNAPTYLSRMFTALADCYTTEDNMGEALQCCERSLEISLAAGDKASAARSYLTSCVLRFMCGDLAGAIQQTRSALALAREVGDEVATAEALAFLGHLYVAAIPEQAAEGVSHLQEAVGLLADAGNKVGLQNAYNLLGAAHHKRGDFKEAWEAFDANRKICFELGLKEEEAYALLNQAITAYELGELAEGLKCVDQADALGLEHGMGVVHALALTFRSAGKAYMGRLAEATKAMNEAVSLFSSSNNKYLEARIQEHRVAFLLVMGRLAEARDAAEALRALLAETGNTEPDGHVLAMLGEARARLGDLDAAEADLEKALAIARAGEAKGLEVQVLRTQAYIALRREKFDLAGQIAKTALLVSHRIGTRYQTAETLGILGESLIASGDAAAAGYFKSMAEDGKAMGATLLEAMGLFGQAAAQPYDEAAKKHAGRAQQLVHAMVVGLDPQATESFWSLTERQRVMSGNYIDFSIKRVQTTGTNPLPRVLPFGGPGGPGGGW
jgi:tetratricopeptide (TPR) repeat protein